MEFEFNNERPIYLQLMEQLELFIVSGILSPGERLPSVRDFSLKIKVNPNTLQKSLNELENLKLIYTERTNGKFVTNDEKLILEFKEKYADEKAAKYLKEMEELGFTNHEAINYLKELGGKHNGIIRN